MALSHSLGFVRRTCSSVLIDVKFLNQHIPFPPYPLSEAPSLASCIFAKGKIIFNIFVSHSYLLVKRTWNSRVCERIVRFLWKNRRGIFLQKLQTPLYPALRSKVLSLLRATLQSSLTHWYFLQVLFPCPSLQRCTHSHMRMLLKKHSQVCCRCFCFYQQQVLAFRMEQFPFHLLLCITENLAISYHYP